MYKNVISDRLNYIKSREDSKINEKESFTAKTEFPVLDKILNGGIQAGLYVVGAMSSVGKTTFIHQVASNIAKQKFKVIYISLEQDDKIMSSKLYSRTSFYQSIEKNKNCDEALSAIEMRYPKKLNSKQFKTYQEAVKASSEIEENLITIDTSMMQNDFTVDKIREICKYAAEKNNNISPIIFVDYLQLLQVPNYVNIVTDKQKTDYNIFKLRALANELNTNITVISSINRASYKDVCSLSAFKESGIIEFSADVAITLTDEEPSANSEDKDLIETFLTEKETISEDKSLVTLKVLKNRMGKAGNNVSTLMSFYKKFNVFEELEL